MVDFDKEKNLFYSHLHCDIILFIFFVYFDV